ncbi:RNA polymerase factor sigma-54 [Acidisoma cellulosilytica]|uniref:RNA polymerase sigma-54 factor n=1 Tax=Acidisoma cellulosilyticum TaxID=2802395 RepID=A0A963Z587_9PROT|nr:RNA polymerase factor sigma-54 [Acidisoma cellulosilyticum]MCB8882290.1 RNA polymerase factor sigma-54 [Acidisoma cellulosilyticum]
MSIGAKIGPRLVLRQSQSLVMTPQLRQAIKLLHYSNQELAGFVQEELDRNPLLEQDERPEVPLLDRPATDQRPEVVGGESDSLSHATSDHLPAPEQAPLDGDFSNAYDAGGVADGGLSPSMSYAGTGRGGSHSFDSDPHGIDDLAESPASLREHLAQQLRLGFADPADRLIGAHLIALLDGAGRITAEPAAIATALGTTLARVEVVRARMMRFDPPGMFARDLKECLAAQLLELNRLDPAMALLLDNLELLARRELKRLMALCRVDAEDMMEMVAEIRRLDPKPGATYESGPIQPLVPDVLLRRAPDGSWHLDLNQETLPRLLVNHVFHARVSASAKREDRVFLSEQLQNANWLVKSLRQRAQTILKVTAEIVRQQDGFLRHGVTHLRPLTLRDVADAVEMHESTVSRVTANKSMATPRGVFELKFFFTTAIGGTSGETFSAEAIRYRIRALIGAEQPNDILSDDAIVAALRKEGVDIARRTVAKYRETLQIPSSMQRKKEKTAA